MHFATGRTPLTTDVGLQTVGLTPGSWLDVDVTCRVRGLPDGWLYAIGDANHRALLTHQGKYQARTAAGRPVNRWTPYRGAATSRSMPTATQGGPGGRRPRRGHAARRDVRRPRCQRVAAHSATIAVAGQIPIDRLWHAVPCFPAISEVWLRLLEAYRDA